MVSSSSGQLIVYFSDEFTVVVLADDIKAVNRFVAAGSDNMSMLSLNGTLVDCDLDYIQ
jgi:hypothetical protein